MSKLSIQLVLISSFKTCNVGFSVWKVYLGFTLGPVLVETDAGEGRRSLLKHLITHIVQLLSFKVVV